MVKTQIWKSVKKSTDPNFSPPNSTKHVFHNILEIVQSTSTVERYHAENSCQCVWIFVQFVLFFRIFLPNIYRYLPNLYLSRIFVHNACRILPNYLLVQNICFQICGHLLNVCPKIFESALAIVCVPFHNLTTTKTVL